MQLPASMTAIVVAALTVACAGDDRQQTSADDVPATTTTAIESELTDFDRSALSGRCDQNVILTGRARIGEPTVPQPRTVGPNTYVLLPSKGEPITIQAASPDLPRNSERLTVTGLVVCERVYAVGGGHSSDVFVAEKSRVAVPSQ